MSRLAKSLIVLTATGGVAYVSIRVLFQSNNRHVIRVYTLLYNTADEALDYISRPAT